MSPEGDQGPEEAPELRLLFWESTARCNLHCAHCRRLDADDASSADELTTDEARRVIDSAAGLGRPVIVFSGGEPLLRDDWEALAAHARRRGLPAALATNGTLVDPPLARRIADAGFRRVSVSLDGADAATHDALRGAPGAFDAAAGGARALRAAGAALQINATLTPQNLPQLNALTDLAEGLGAEALHLFVLVPVGCGLQLGDDRRLSPAQVEEALEWVCRMQARGRIELKATCAPHYYRVARQWLARREGAPAGGHPPGQADHVRAAVRGRGCLAGVGVLFVSSAGEVFPCGYLPVSCGSVRRADLGEIWRSSGVLRRLRDYELLTGKCGCCEYRAVCGGCRARAYAATGDYLAEEPMCTYAPGRP